MIVNPSLLKGESVANKTLIPWHGLAVVCAAAVVLALPAMAARPPMALAGTASPTVKHVCAVDPQILLIEIQAGTRVPSKLVPYKKAPGDEIRTRKGAAGKQELVLVRRGREMAWVVNAERTFIRSFDRLVGDPLDTGLADAAATFKITSPDDPAYEGGKAPARISRKSKPTNWVDSDRVKAPTRHYIYLHLPSALVEGARYTLDLKALKTSPATVTYRHEPTRVRSEAVHVSHLGFRGDDPGKRGYLSVWLGSGGAHTYGKELRFRVVNTKTGATAVKGDVTLAVAAADKEKTRVRANHNQTDVHRMDFAALKQPGTYVLVVDGIGSSWPFEIGPDVWRKAFVKSLRGFYHQRTGIEIGPPHSEFRRPRNFHAADGCVFHELSVQPQGQAAKEGRDRKGYRTGKVLGGVYGGYHDAGDWDMRIHHVDASRGHLELLELFGDFFTKIKHNIPESGNKLPDLLDEALWNMDLYRRLQRADGAIYHGVEEAPTGGKVFRGGPSWLHKDLIVYPPDPWTAYKYAGAAARTALLLKPYDQDRAHTFERSALKAMAWAQANENDASVLKTARLAVSAKKIVREKALAAVELYRLTKDRKWHDVFRGSTPLTSTKWRGDPTIFTGANSAAAFVYVRLPDDMTDKDLKDRAGTGLIAAGDRSIEYGRGNAFNVVHANKWMPLILGFFSTPHAVELARAHWLSGDAKYIEAMVRACGYGVGANPMNLSMTTGVGHRAVKHPLHLDSRWTGQPIFEGITVYGPFDFKHHGHKKNTWAFKWFYSKQCFPSGWDWPVTESYFDTFGYPTVNEFTMHQTMGPTSYVWGYLAARGR